MACSARSAIFRATEPKLERVTFRDKSRGIDAERRTPVSEPEKSPDALIEQRGHTLILTLNRPEARNALSTEMLSIMVEAWDRVDDDPEIRIVHPDRCRRLLLRGHGPQGRHQGPARRLVQERRLRPDAHRRAC